jgi:hypothetical protein
MNRMCTLIAVVFLTLLVLSPGVAPAQGDGTVSTTVIDAETFITVKETVGGDVLALYRIRSDRIILVDAVVNTSNRDAKLPKRYLHRLDLENR